MKTQDKGGLETSRHSVSALSPFAFQLTSRSPRQHRPSCFVAGGGDWTSDRVGRVFASDVYAKVPVVISDLRRQSFLAPMIRDLLQICFTRSCPCFIAPVPADSRVCWCCHTTPRLSPRCESGYPIPTTTSNPAVAARFRVWLDMTFTFPIGPLIKPSPDTLCAEGAAASVPCLCQSVAGSRR